MKPRKQAAPEPASKEKLRLWLKLLKASRVIEEEVRRRLRKEYGNTLPRFDVMSALHRTPEGLKMSEISKLLRVSNGNITGIVDKLGEEGLALRVPIAGDRRAHQVRLTKRGFEVFEEHAKAHEAWISEILSGLDTSKLDEMNGCMDQLTDALEGGTDV